MMRGSQESMTERKAQGPCHRCGWTLEVTKVPRMQAKQLHFGRHAAQLCNECITDLRCGEVTKLTDRPAATAGHVVARHRHRVA